MKRIFIIALLVAWTAPGQAAVGSKTLKELQHEYYTLPSADRKEWNDYMSIYVQGVVDSFLNVYYYEDIIQTDEEINAIYECVYFADDGQQGQWFVDAVYTMKADELKEVGDYTLGKYLWLVLRLSCSIDYPELLGPMPEWTNPATQEDTSHTSEDTNHRT